MKAKRSPSARPAVKSSSRQPKTRKSNGAQKRNPPDWEKRYKEMRAERDRLQQEMLQIQSERDQYLKSLHYYVRQEKFEFDEEEVAAVLANPGQGQSLEELIAELKSSSK